VNLFVDVTEVRAFLAEHKITFKELSDEPDPKTEDSGSPKDKGTATPPKGSGDAVAPSDADEKAAASRLSRAKIFAEGDENRATYIEKLKAIIKQFPATKAAKEAKKLLDAAK